jgi:putative flippase GtrA
MTDRLRLLMQRPSSRYLVIGGSVYALELVIIFSAQHFFGASALVAVGLSFWIGLIVSFAFQKLITFSDRRLHHRVLIPQVAAFSLLVLFNFGFTLGVTKLLGSHVPAAVSRTIALGLTTIWNFYLYKTRIFNTPLETI